jgi:hypothetical protein
MPIYYTSEGEILLEPEVKDLDGAYGRR